MPEPQINPNQPYAKMHYQGELTVYNMVKEQIAKEKAIVTTQQIANQQQIMNEKYDALLVQYQQLLQTYIAEKNTHAQETAALMQLRAEMARISDILRSVGLM